MEDIQSPQEVAVCLKRNVYSVWALPPVNVRRRLKSLMDGLASDFGSPNFEPHVTVVGAMDLTEADAVQKLRAVCDGLKLFDVSVDKVDCGTFFYQCVYLLLHPTPQIMEANVHCSNHFGYKSSSGYMPHLSLLYGDLTNDAKKIAMEKAKILDAGVSDLRFPITSLSLWRTDTADKSLKSWEKISECSLISN